MSIPSFPWKKGQLKVPAPFPETRTSPLRLKSRSGCQNLQIIIILPFFNAMFNRATLKLWARPNVVGRQLHRHPLAPLPRVGQHRIRNLCRHSIRALRGLAVCRLAAVLPLPPPVSQPRTLGNSPTLPRAKQPRRYPAKGSAMPGVFPLRSISESMIPPHLAAHGRYHPSLPQIFSLGLNP